MPVKLGRHPGAVGKNAAVADHLIMISMGMTIDGANRFRVKSFETAAENLILESRDIGMIDPSTVTGVGSSVAEVITEYLSTGTSVRYEDLAKRVPMEALTMSQVDGIGAKGCINFHADGIHNFDELVKVAHEVPCRLKDRVRDAVLFAVNKTRIPHAQAKELAETCVHDLHNKSSVTSVLKYEICGSIRRKSVDSKDVDIVGCYTRPEDVSLTLNAFTSLGQVISRGDNRASIRYTFKGTTMQVDLWLVPPESWGSVLNYSTGSKEHCVAVRMLAKSHGMLVNEYGIWKLNENGEPKERLGGYKETDLYDILGLPYVEPENRIGDLPNKASV